MKKMIWTFIACNVGALIFFFLPTGMLLTDSPDGANWSNFRFLCIVYTIPSIIVWWIYRKVKGTFIMFLIFETLMLSYVLWMFLSVKNEI
ncbi:hypothetical protein [Bacillus sp. ISL-7]|uniref:hypothetical protein n=1 Tax=Bacillus sp. ISL-7 TaxID=2819136 RepID=UPI001BE9D1C0|nr:hypothetical protein [Bacillus sp. ISL-7]MBT2739075.1 hypothetical protein [Bacillus sp. ISL-7]